MTINKYYINLGFANHRLTTFHTSILYLENLEDKELKQIKNVINEYLKKDLGDIQGVKFNKTQFFDSKKVLMCELSELNWLLHLIKELSRIKKSKYNFRPHITLHGRNKKINSVVLQPNRISIIQKSTKSIKTVFTRYIKLH